MCALRANWHAQSIDGFAHNGIYSMLTSHIVFLMHIPLYGISISLMPMEICIERLYGKLEYMPRNRPRSIYQYSNISTRLLGQSFTFGVVFFVSKSLLRIERQKKLKKNLKF